MTTIDRFKLLPAKKRASIIHHVINVQGMKSPRTKAAKDMDKIRYPEPLKGEQNFKRALFNTCLVNHL